METMEVTDKALDLGQALDQQHEKLIGMSFAVTRGRLTGESVEALLALEVPDAPTVQTQRLNGPNPTPQTLAEALAEIDWLQEQLRDSEVGHQAALDALQGISQLRQPNLLQAVEAVKIQIDDLEQQILAQVGL